MRGRTAGRRAAGLVLGLLLVLPAITARPAHALWCDYFDTVCHQLQQAQNQQSSVESQLKTIAQNLADTQQKADWTLRIIRQLDAQVAAQRAAVAATQKRVADTERRIRFTQADISRREAQLTVRQQLLDQRVRALDKHGGLNYFELVVTSESFSQLVDRVVIMQDVIRSDQQLIDQLRVERDQIQGLVGQLQVQQAQDAALLAQQQQQQAALEKTLADQQAALAYLQELEAQYVQQQQERQAELNQLSGQIAVLQQQYVAEARGLGGGSGRFGWPLEAPISQGYGCSDVLFEWYDPNCPPPHTFHYGIDIAGPYGADILAADSGVVSQVSSGGCFGNHIVITHGNGYSTWYAHLSAILVSAGQPVHRGQLVGREGSSGCSTGPHLHFGLWYNGWWVNPMPYLG